MRPVVIGIAGGTGSGKTTVATKIIEALPPDGAALIQHDWYYRDLSHLPGAERDAINFDEPGALENDLLRDHLIGLKEGRPAECPDYDFATHTRQRTVHYVPAQPIIVVEGILLFAVPSLRDVIDLRLFVETDDDVRLLRRIRRDIEERGRDMASIEAQYVTTVRPMHVQHVVPSRAHAHLIIPEGGQNAPALEVIIGRLLQLITVSGRSTLRPQ
jgi:uridine kinase